MKRTPLKRSSIPLKRSRIKRKAPSTEVMDREREEKEAMWNVFLEIWKERIHKCEETNVPLYGEPLTIMFHHLLHKETYPQFKLLKQNIILVHPDVHTLAHSDIDKTPVIKRRTEQLKEQLL